MPNEASHRPGDMTEDLSSVFFSEECIQQKIGEIGQAISTDYMGKNPLMVGVLRGVLFFMADLLRAVTIPLDWMKSIWR